MPKSKSCAHSRCPHGNCEPKRIMCAGAPIGAAHEMPIALTLHQADVDAQHRYGLSVNVAVRVSGLSRSVIYELMRDGHLVYRQIGRRRLILWPDLRDLLHALPTGQGQTNDPEQIVEEPPSQAVGASRVARQSQTKHAEGLGPGLASTPAQGLNTHARQAPKPGRTTAHSLKAQSPRATRESARRL